MPVDTTVPKSPGWWLARLTKRLVEEQRPAVEKAQRYLDGDHPVPDIFDTEQERDSARPFLQNAQSNYLALVSDSVVERMKIVGWRAGPTDRQGDQNTMALWNAAAMEADQILLTRDFIGLGYGFVMVGSHPRKRGKVLITVEDPRFVVTEPYPDDHREVQAGLKLWVDEFGYGRATLFLPTRTVRYRSPSSLPVTSNHSMTQIYKETALRTWEVLEDVRNPLNVVPIVPFLNKRTNEGRGKSEIADVIDSQNRINQTLLIRLLAEKFGALRQRAILNLAFGEEPEVDEAGVPTGETVVVAPELPNTPGVAWLLDGEHLEVWESAQTDTSGIIKAIESDIRDLAAISRTPPHYLLNSIVNASADSLKSAETGLVSKVRERISQASQGWIQVMRLALAVSGQNERASEDAPLEPIWADPESRSLAEVSDAATKQQAVGLPWRALMELLGKSPAEIDRLAAMRTEDAMLALLAAPQPQQIGAVPVVSSTPNQPSVTPDDEEVEEES